MTKLILKIILLNVGLFVILVVLYALFSFGMGYAENSHYQRQQMIIYLTAALIQVGVNLLIYKRYMFNDLRVITAIIIVVVLLYLITPFAMKL